MLNKFLRACSNIKYNIFNRKQLNEINENINKLNNKQLQTSKIQNKNKLNAKQQIHKTQNVSKSSNKQAQINKGRYHMLPLKNKI